MRNSTWTYTDAMELAIEDLAIDRHYIFANSLVSRWPDFVDCSLRLRTEGPFLLNILSDHNERILDAAMGMGCETLFLTKQGFNVIGNEIDPHFQELATMYARRASIELETTSIDWRELPEYFGEQSFDSVLVLGNSLCLLQDRIAREQAAQSFRRICRRGGKLIVDQRNFDYILHNPTSSLGKRFRYSRKVMYCGTKVIGYPVSVAPDCICFAYEDVQTGQILGYLDMYPFHQDEMINLFRSVGFEEIEMYSDLESGYRKDADFYTYILR